MKIFSLLSATALTTMVAVSGFCDEQLVNYQTASEKQSNILAHDPNAPDDHPSSIDRDQDSRIRRIERMHGDTGMPPPPPDVVINSAAGCMEHGFAVEAEFLWWRAHLDDLEYALRSGPSIIAVPVADNFNLEAIEPNFEYDPGVRISAGYDFGRRNWDIFLRWTYHYTSPTDSTGTNDPEYTLIAYPVQSIRQSSYGGLVLANTGRVKWNNQLNALDFEMGYDYFFSDRFSIRPHMGIKAAWINMHYLAKYMNVVELANAGGFLTLPEMAVRSKSHFWGVGPRVGIDGSLHIGWGFSLYGMTSASMLYGQFDTKFNLISPEGISWSIKQDDYFRLRAVGQLAFGVNWGWCFSRKYFLSLHLGWETQYWWDQLEMRFLERFEPDADLTYNGLTTGIRFDF